MFKILFALFLVLIYSWNSQLFCQETSSASNAYQYAENLYHQSIKKQTLLVNGSEYVPTSGRLEGHPYLTEGMVEDGVVIYDDIMYKKVRISYDLVQDELILQYISSNGSVELLKLHKEKVNRFSIHDQWFFYYPSGRWANLREGFYQLLYQGKTLFLKKISKEAQEVFDRLEVTTYFREKQKYFVIQDGEANEIKNKRSLLQLFSKKKTQLKNYIQTENLTFRQENDMLKLIQYYDQIQP